MPSATGSYGWEHTYARVASSVSAQNPCPSPSAMYTARRSTSSRRTVSYCPKVGEPTRTSTITSSRAPRTQVTYLAWLGGTLM
ncbi:MAG: hypothetical protein AUG44_00485 [Actinobacteria bacterium 13_1_20CM_3_71_11]|nr:MAG: hypothetical protein AUG44_00485 [Actinobacteria bacterium 13_1_20CM_3_71_11]